MNSSSSFDRSQISSSVGTEVAVSRSTIDTFEVVSFSTFWPSSSDFCSFVKLNSPSFKKLQTWDNNTQEKKAGQGIPLTGLWTNLIFLRGICIIFTFHVIFLTRVPVPVSHPCIFYKGVRNIRGSYNRPVRRSRSPAGRSAAAVPWPGPDGTA